MLSGRNGYLYGRGTTDNKGPVIAVACAAAELLSRRALELDLVLLIEGEEEAGSSGFNETVRRHKDAIGPIDAILVRLVDVHALNSNRNRVLNVCLQQLDVDCGGHPVHHVWFAWCRPLQRRGESHVVRLAAQTEPELDTKVSSGGPDLHSGVDGGATTEPMLDM